MFSQLGQRARLTNEFIDKRLHRGANLRGVFLRDDVQVQISFGEITA